jgi:hypothetical protein
VRKIVSESGVGKKGAWWRENRPGAPDLFTNELDHALVKLEQAPTIGTRYEAGMKTVRS